MTRPRRSLPSGARGRRRRERGRLGRCYRLVVAVERSDWLIGTSVGHARTRIGKFFGFEFSGSVEVALAMPSKPVEVRSGSLAPGFECVGIGLPQLFLCGQAIRKLFENYIG